MSDYLKIPPRERKRFEYVFCLKCDKNVSTHCRNSGKKIHTCKYADQHRFRVQLYTPDGPVKRPSRIFDTRDYKEFTKQASEYIESMLDPHSDPIVPEKEELPTPKQREAVEVSSDNPVVAQPTQQTFVEQAKKEGRPIRLIDASKMYLDWLQDVGVDAFNNGLIPKTLGITL